MNDIRKVGILGGGLMGSGIAQVAAQAGFRTVVREVNDSLAQRARGTIEKALARGVSRGKVTAEEREGALAQLYVTARIDELADCDIVIEAVVEDLDVKNGLWKELDAICPERTIFASNTSSLTIAAMAAATKRADRMVGLHFFNPVPLMKLVEVVKTVTTSEATFENAYQFARALGKEPIRAKDNSGFVVNLLLVPYLIDAIHALESGVASIEDIDKGMQ